MYINQVPSAAAAAAHHHNQQQQQQQQQLASHGSSASHCAHNLIRLMTNSVINTVTFMGFDVAQYEKTHKQPFNTTLFSKPNAKAFEYIVHHLLSKLDQDKAQRVFGQCWPPILKEQQKEFKDALLSWLSEISGLLRQQLTTTTTTTATTTASSGLYGAKSQTNGAPPPYLALAINSTYSSLFMQIKFPLVTKSLLMTPGGLKTCELLFALSQFVLAMRLIQQIEHDKLHVRLLPKVSPFSEPHSGRILLSSQAHNVAPGGAGAGGSLTQGGSCAPAAFAHSTSAAKMITQRQLVHYDVLVRSLREKLHTELAEINKLTHAIQSDKCKRQQYAHGKVVSIQQLTERKCVRSAALAASKRLLVSLMSSSSGSVRELTRPAVATEVDEAAAASLTLEALGDQLAGNDQFLFEKNWALLSGVVADTVDNETRQRHVADVVRGESDAIQLNGRDLIQGAGADAASTEVATTAKSTTTFDEQVVRLLFQHIDKNATIRNCEIGPLFTDNGTKLDLVNMMKMRNLTLILKAEQLTKIDKNRLDAMGRSLFGGGGGDMSLTSNNESNDLLDSSGFPASSSSLAAWNGLGMNGSGNGSGGGCALPSVKSINENIIRLKQKLDIFVPKLKAKCAPEIDALLHSEENSTSHQTADSTDEAWSSEATLIDEYFAFSRRSNFDQDKLNALEKAAASSSMKAAEESASDSQKLDELLAVDFVRRFSLNGRPMSTRQPADEPRATQHANKANTSAADGADFLQLSHSSVDSHSVSSSSLTSASGLLHATSKPDSDNNTGSKRNSAIKSQVSPILRRDLSPTPPPRGPDGDAYDNATVFETTEAAASKNESRQSNRAAENSKNALLCLNPEQMKDDMSMDLVDVLGDDSFSSYSKEGYNWLMG